MANPTLFPYFASSNTRIPPSKLRNVEVNQELNANLWTKVNIKCNKRTANIQKKIGKELTRTYWWTILRIFSSQRDKFGIFNQLSRKAYRMARANFRIKETKRRYCFQRERNTNIIPKSLRLRIEKKNLFDDMNFTDARSI